MTIYMNPETGSLGTKNDWYYQDINGKEVNAVDLGEVVPVDLFVFVDGEGNEVDSQHLETLGEAVQVAKEKECNLILEGQVIWANPEIISDSDQ